MEFVGGFRFPASPQLLIELNRYLVRLAVRLCERHLISGFAADFERRVGR